MRGCRHALGVVLALVFGAGPVAAQTARDRLEIEVARTDRVLAEAQTVVSASENDRAQNLLALATRLQEVAHESLTFCGERVGACETAARATTSARREALKAIRIAREQSSYEEESARLLGQTASLLDEARRILSEKPDPRRERLLDQATAQLERAREQDRIRHFQVSIRLSQNAERLTRQAMDVGGSGEVAGERLERELARTDRLIERARGFVGEGGGDDQGGNDEARRLIEQATAFQARARSAQGEGRPLLSLRLTREAQDLTAKALRLADDGADQAQVEIALDQTDQLIERLEPVVRASAEPEALKLFEEAQKHQARARNLGGEKQWSLALAQTRVARNLVLDAEVQAGEGDLRP
jgi:hypothetical protein